MNPTNPSSNNNPPIFTYAALTASALFVGSPVLSMATRNPRMPLFTGILFGATIAAPHLYQKFKDYKNPIHPR